MAEPRPTPLRVTPQAKREVEHASAEWGMDQKDITSRLVHWFHQQDRRVKAAILYGLEPPIDVPVVWAAPAKK
jgi:hypothetical protein